MRKIDTLVTHAHLFTMAGDGVGYVADGAVAVDRGAVVETGATADLAPRYDPAETLDASDCAVLPGLVDAHMHAPLAILRGVAQDVAHWMQRALAPYTRHLTREARLAGCRLNAVEALLAGTTTHVENSQAFPGWAEFYAALGVRARLAPMVNDLPPGGMAGWKLGDLYPLDADAGRARIDDAFAFARQWHGAQGGRVTVMIGAHAPDMITRENLLDIKRRADDAGLMIHMHVAQGDREIDQMVKRYGQRTPQYLADLGCLDEGLLAIHLTEASDEEAAMIAGHGARMAVCSGSIGIIDGIVPPAVAFRRAGGLVALGSDQACGNNCNNVFNEMKLTALFNKIKYRDPTVMPAWEVLRMATIEGARAVGLGDQVGSLEAGKRADLILVDLTAPNLMPVIETPVRNIVPNLVYAGSGHEVRTVMVDGRLLMRDGALQSADLDAIHADAHAQAAALAQRVAADPIHRQMSLMAAMEAGQL